MIFLRLLNILFFIQVISKEQCDKFKAYENYEEAKLQGIIKNVKRYDQYLGVMKDQESVGNCYAYGVADLIEHHLKSKKNMPVEEHISSMSITLNYKRQQLQEANRHFVSLGQSRDIVGKIFKDYQDKLELLEDELKNKTDYLYGIRYGNCSSRKRNFIFGQS